MTYVDDHRRAVRHRDRRSSSPAAARSRCCGSCPTTARRSSSAGRSRASFWSPDQTRVALGLGVARRRSPSSPSTIGHVRDTLQTARALGDVLRVLLSVSLAVEVLSGILLDMPFRFLGIQGNIAQLGPIQGIFGTRNLLGFVAVLALITFLIEYRTQSVRPGVSLVSVVLAGGLAALCDSPTVLVLAVARRRRRRRARARAPRPPGASRRAAVDARRRSSSSGSSSATRRGIRSSRWLGAGTDFSMRVEPVEHDASTSCGMHPVQGWGWFGPWDPSEYPVHRDQLPAAHRPRHRPERLLRRAAAARLDRPAALPRARRRSPSCAPGSSRASAARSSTRGRRSSWSRSSSTRCSRASRCPGFGWLLLVLCAVRAGQSRSWRERIDGRGRPSGPGGLPHAGDARRTIQGCEASRTQRRHGRLRSRPDASAPAACRPEFST